MEEVREDYFTARKSQLTSTVDRDRFVDQWMGDTSPHSTTDLSTGFGDTTPTIDLPDDTNRELWADQWDKEGQQTEAQLSLQQAVSTYHRRLFLTIIAAVGITAAAVIAAVIMFRNQDPASTWLPAGFRPVEDAELYDGKVNGHLVYEKIERRIDGVNDPVVFVLVVDGDSPARPFYIMQYEVWNGLFGRFAEENPELIGRDTEDGPGIWKDGPMKKGKKLGASNLLVPVVNVSVEEAHRCAVWIGGRLPTVEEWNTAAGYYYWKQTSSGDGAERVGPFMGVWPGQGGDNKPDIAVDKRGPFEVGKSRDDVSRFGCHDMAGNVEELTCIVEGTHSRVPVDNPGPNTSVFKRGKCYADLEPHLFVDVEDLDTVSSQVYSQSSEYVGFRVVIEIK